MEDEERAKLRLEYGERILQKDIFLFFRKIRGEYREGKISTAEAIKETDKKYVREYEEYLRTIELIRKEKDPYKKENLKIKSETLVNGLDFLIENLSLFFQEELCQK